MKNSLINGNLNPVIVIPARMGSTRLPGKPLCDINGQPMIVHVLRRAEQANIGPVVVAVAEEIIAEAVIAAGGNVVMTEPELPSGSDRVWHAVEKFDPSRKYNFVINLQGDLPGINPKTIQAILNPVQSLGCEISTLASEIKENQDCNDKDTVKVVIAFQNSNKLGTALYFSRVQIPFGQGPFYHHIGIYGYTRDALEKFICLPTSILEKREKLEQLRALEAGTRIGVEIVDTVPDGVDTPADLDRVRNRLESE